MIKGRKIRGIIVAIALIICTAVSVAADSSKGWNIEHKVWNANFYGNVSLSVRNGLFKSVITYYGHISGAERDKCTLSENAAHHLFRHPSDEVGTLMISTKRYNNGNMVREYIGNNRQLSTTQYKDYVKSDNVNLEFGNERDYVSSEFTLD